MRFLNFILAALLPLIYAQDSQAQKIDIVRDHAKDLLTGERRNRLVEIEEDLWGEGLVEQGIMPLERASVREYLILVRGGSIVGYFLSLASAAVQVQGDCAYSPEVKLFVGRDCIFGTVRTDLALDGRLEQVSARRGIFK